ncbi:response regulator transcription factor [Burkholderia guangdongensis]|uniref:response regulator transcription factor n=1 Tax=Burkholderia guangdongensis TaxID=1792500 RepID=UPI0015CDEE88|nr:response regulator [Burkholderia guangdongensis]
MESVDEWIYVVDDDERVRNALSALLRANGRNVRSFASGREFLSAPRPDAVACLILDMKMPGMSGLEVQRFVTGDTQIPVVFVTGRGDVPSTVLAMKGGAVDFLTKPVDEQALMQAVDAALAKARELRRDVAEATVLQALYLTLTPRERELLPLLTKGLLNKQAAGMLGITEYTVQIHRGRIMRKMRADSFATLVRQASKLQLDEPPATASDA